ncbi:MAG: hypothetical protein RMK29_11950 [Myxococcales bacterium]|nr:hypothetical protein [Myxococcota bacterium]MDW8282422.1 hypothetical protein [Myxococcales bacterium]
MKKHAEKLLRDVELRDLRRLTAGQVHHRAPAWAPGGRWLSMELGEGDGTCRLICDGKGRPARVLEGPAEGGASFSPDGTLAYGRRVGATLEIWQLDSGSHTPRRLLGGDGRLYRDPAFSQDGRWLCYAADDPAHPGGPTRLWLYDVRRAVHVPVLPAEPELHLTHPAWTPAGDALFCEGSNPRGTSILAIDLAGGSLRQVTEPEERYRRPAPLGNDLLLVERALASGTSELVLLDLHGGGVHCRRLTPAQRCAREPALVRRKGALLVAFAMMCRADKDEPQRYEVYVGRITGLRRRLSRSGTESRGSAEA